jgi:hypothetical protein
MSEHEKHGGRTVKSPHSPEHYKDIETPFNHGGEVPHHGSSPDHYAPHQEHTRKHLHGK